jgi:hypothetical protein
MDGAFVTGAPKCHAASSSNYPAARRNFVTGANIHKQRSKNLREPHDRVNPRHHHAGADRHQDEHEDAWPADLGHRGAAFPLRGATVRRNSVSCNGKFISLRR